MTGVGIDSSSSSPPPPLLFLSPPPSPPSMSSFYFYSPSTPSTEVQSSSQLSLCSACEKKTEQRCSKCKVTFFCSTQCQRLLFPTHKFLCSKSTSTFRAPPLTQITRSRVEAIRDKPYFDHACDVKGRTLVEHVKMLGYFRKDGTFEELMDGITKGGNLLPEPALTACALLARNHLITDCHARDETYREDTASERCWITVSGYACTFITTRRVLLDHENPLEILSIYFRKFTNWVTLYTMNQLEPFSVRKKATAELVARLSPEVTVNFHRISPYLAHWIKDFHKRAVYSYGEAGKGSGRKLMLDDEADLPKGSAYVDVTLDFCMTP